MVLPISDIDIFIGYTCVMDEGSFGSNTDIVAHHDNLSDAAGGYVDLIYPLLDNEFEGGSEYDVHSVSFGFTNPMGVYMEDDNDLLQTLITANNVMARIRKIEQCRIAILTEKQRLSKIKSSFKLEKTRLATENTAATTRVRELLQISDFRSKILTRRSAKI
jgi:hypothetical protein